MTVLSAQDGKTSGLNWSSVTSEEDNYGYVNSRLRARFRDFFDGETYRKLLYGNLRDFEREILMSPYEEFYRKNFLLNLDPLAQKLEHLISAVAERRLLQVKSWCRGELRILFAVLSIQADLENGLFFLRALKTGHLQRPSVLGYGQLEGAFWLNLWPQIENHAMIHDLCRCQRSDLSGYLSEAVRQLDDGCDSADTEFYYLKSLILWAFSLLSKCKGNNAVLVHHYLQQLVDIWNIRLWIFNQRKLERISFPKYLEGGDQMDLERLVLSKNYTALFRGTSWHPSKNSPFGLLDLLERQFLDWQLAQKRIDPLGIHVIVAYRARQLIEWKNLGNILAGIQGPLKRSVIETALAEV